METASKIRQYLEKCYAPDLKEIHLTEQTRLLEEKVIDSIGMVELMSFVEETFGIEIPEEEISPDHFGTISKLACYIDSKRT